MFHHHSAPLGNKGFRHLANGLCSRDSNVTQRLLASTSYLHICNNWEAGRWSLLNIGFLQKSCSHSVAEVKTLAGIVSRGEINIKTSGLGKKKFLYSYIIIYIV